METNERQIMSTPHKATPGEWKKVRNWAENESYADSVLLEVADRVAALEEASSELAGTIASADSDLEKRITALESQHNLVVDNITDLLGCVNQLEAATQPPAPAADHSRGATEMVATDEELIEAFYVGARGALAIPGFRAVYNLGRQYSAQSRQEEEATPPPAPDGGLVQSVAGVIWNSCDLEIGARNAIHCVADWLQQRSSTIANGSRWAEMLRTETDRSSAAQPRPVPQPPAPAGGLVEELASVAAQAVLTELTQQEYGLDPADIPREAARMAQLAATAIRAAADQVASPSEILAISDELERRANG
jgi:hypothetical protein